ncbi:hypothetical protein GCM10027038_40880 [Arthrobacter bambusae]
MVSLAATRSSYANPNPAHPVEAMASSRSPRGTGLVSGLVKGAMSPALVQQVAISSGVLEYVIVLLATVRG